MIIRDNSVKPGDLHKPEQSKKRGEELILDFGRPLTEEEKKIFAKCKKDWTYKKEYMDFRLSRLRRDTGKAAPGGWR